MICAVCKRYDRRLIAAIQKGDKPQEVLIRKLWEAHKDLYHRVTMPELVRNPSRIRRI